MLLKVVFFSQNILQICMLSCLEKGNIDPNGTWARQQKVSWGNTLDQERSLEQTGKNLFVFFCYLWGQESVPHNNSLGRRYAIIFLSRIFTNPFSHLFIFVREHCVMLAAIPLTVNYLDCNLIVLCSVLH